MWWHGPKPSCSSASLSDNVPVRGMPAPMTDSGKIDLPLSFIVHLTRRARLEANTQIAYMLRDRTRVESHGKNIKIPNEANLSRKRAKKCQKMRTNEANSNPIRSRFPVLRG
jgi:hypothetical protein